VADSGRNGKIARTNGGHLARLRSLYPSLRPAERRVADLVLRHSDLFARLTSRQIGQRCRTSEATVVRFCQTLGYRGIPELKAKLVPDLLTAQGTLYTALSDRDGPAGVIEKVIRISIRSLEETLTILDPAVVGRAVQAILHAKRVQFFGGGGGGGIAHLAVQKFLRLGIPAAQNFDLVSQRLSLEFLKPGDVAVGLSYSGTTREVVESLTQARAKGVTTIAITNFPRSPLAKVADLTLLTAVVPPFVGSHAGPHRVTQLAVIEILTTALALRLLRNGRRTEVPRDAAMETV
jgi:DNA-binding MurR/RpiR family transcriptional regulator